MSILTGNQKRMNTFWEKSEIALQNYRDYLSNKTHNDLEFIDLLYISNFKGGNATMNEPEKAINQKLKNYTLLFNKIRHRFESKQLKDLTDVETDELCLLLEETLALTLKPNTAIDGFKSSFLSALLHAHFPDLIPILDRRLLINLKVITRKDQLDSQGQVKKIHRWYPDLIRVVQKKLSTGVSIRELDKEYFVMELLDWT